MDAIEELCKKYTDLTDEEIATIRGMSAVLQPLANLEDADIFIDCPSWDGDAIVVAEAKPSYVPSSYKKTVVGLLARKENEPAVARTFRLGVATKQMKAVTQENGSTIQSVEPIRNTAGDRVIGVLIREQRVDVQRKISERLHFSEQSHERIANALAHMVGSNHWLTECIDEALLMVDKSGMVAFATAWPGISTASWGTSTIPWASPMRTCAWRTPGRGRTSPAFRRWRPQWAATASPSSASSSTARIWPSPWSSRT